jgi:hypothetical protein
MDFDYILHSLTTNPRIKSAVTDPRMKSVWDELKRRNAKTGDLLYPSHAADVLLLALIILTSASRTVVPLRKAEAERDRLLEKAAILRSDAKRYTAAMATIGADSVEVSRLACLTDAALFYEEHAAALFGIGKKAIVDRDTGDGEARFFAISLCSLFREEFGRPAMHHTISKIATVVLEREIPVHKVKEWCRQR